MSPKAKNAAAPTVEGGAACPKCGALSWDAQRLVTEKTEARDHAERQFELDTLVSARGARVRCRGCGYVTHALDDLSPAKS